jgi:hypothetical protein
MSRLDLVSEGGNPPLIRRIEERCSLLFWGSLSWALHFNSQAIHWLPLQLSPFPPIADPETRAT